MVRAYSFPSGIISNSDYRAYTRPGVQTPGFGFWGHLEFEVFRHIFRTRFEARSYGVSFALSVTQLISMWSRAANFGRCRNTPQGVFSRSVAVRRILERALKRVPTGVSFAQKTSVSLLISMCLWPVNFGNA
jgi:hypothetical protein